MRRTLRRMFSISILASALLLLAYGLTIQVPRKPGVSFCGSSVCATQHHHDTMPHAHSKDLLTTIPPFKVRYTETDLKTWYTFYNEVYFDGKLPNDTILRLADMQEEGFMGLTQHVDGTFLITIDPAFNPAEREARATLLHEMVHVAVFPEFFSHGPRWHVRLRRLIVDGAFDDLV